MTHTEKVHVLFGALMALMGASAAWAYRHPRSPIRFVWPVSAFLLGFFMFVPVERQTRTYVDVGWWDTFRSAFPANVVELRDFASAWIAKLAMFHVLEHKVVGLLGMVAGVVEFQRARGTLGETGWRWALPIALIGVGLALGLHGGNAEHLPHHVEVVHHRIMGGCFVAGGALLGLVEVGALRADPWRAMWTVLLMVAGVDLVLFYRIH